MDFAIRIRMVPNTGWRRGFDEEKLKLDGKYAEFAQNLGETAEGSF